MKIYKITQIWTGRLNLATELKSSYVLDRLFQRAITRAQKKCLAYEDQPDYSYAIFGGDLGCSVSW